LNPKSPNKILSIGRNLHKTYIVLILIVILGAILRFNGLGFGLPLRLHTDEMAVVEYAAAVAESGDLNPGTYNRPNHVSIYLSALLYKPLSGIRCLFFNDCRAIPLQLLRNPTPYVYLSRSITACLGILMILVMFFLGKEVGGRNVGLFSSALTAFFPSFIRHSHYVTPDIPLAFYISLVVLFTCKYMKTRKLKFLFLGCLFCALATAEKYPGILSMALIFFGVLFSHRRMKEKILKLLPLSALAFLSSLFVAAPYLFLRYREVFRAMAEERASYHMGASGLGWGGNLLYYLGTLFDNTGMLVALFFLLGLVFFIFKFKAYIGMKHYLSVVLFGLFYWVFLSFVAIHWERWAVPMYIVPILITSVGIEQLSIFLKKKQKGWNFILSIFLAIMLSSLFCRGGMESLSFSWKDTRVVSRRWILLNLPADAKKVSDAYSPLKPGCCGSVAEKSLEELKQEGVEYVIVSSFIYQRILDESENFPNEVIFYTRLFENEYLVEEFSPVNVEIGMNDLSAVYRSLRELIRYIGIRDSYLRGPVIKIYRISDG